MEVSHWKCEKTEYVRACRRQIGGELEVKLLSEVPIYPFELSGHMPKNLKLDKDKMSNLIQYTLGSKDGKFWLLTVPVKP